MGALPAGVEVGKPSPIFPRVDLAKVRGRAGQEVKPPAAEVLEQKLITLKQFQELDLRVAKVLAAEPIAGADKLLKLSLDVGEEQPRQVVAGLATRYRPEELVGRTVVLVANLEPATIRGVESQGMVLAAGEREPLSLVVLDSECPPGTKVR